jgi:hypothetical protein
MRPSRRVSRLVALAPLAALALALALSGPAGASPALAPPDARLQGTFTAHGFVFRSVNVPGEHRGERVIRTWSFTPTCPAGVCATVELERQRGPHGLDRILLHHRRSDYYTGQGNFTAPARCGGRNYPAGERVPFTITLTVRAVAQSGSSLVATAFTATYRNRRRINLTRCVLASSHDAARYTGVLTSTTQPAGSTRRLAMIRSSTGS